MEYNPVPREDTLDTVFQNGIIPRLLSELQELAGKDDTTKAGTWKLILANLHSTTDAVSDLMKDISDNIVQEVQSSHPAAIQIEVECDDEVNEEKESTSKPRPRRVTW